MFLYDLSSKSSLNCNVLIPSPQSSVEQDSRKQYILSSDDTKVFRMPSPEGIIRLKHYTLKFDYVIGSVGQAEINITVDPFPSYDTVWIQFCKAIHYILEKTQSQIVMVKNPHKTILIPPLVFNKHYTITKKLSIKRYAL